MTTLHYNTAHTLEVDKENLRLQALNKYNILDTPAEEEFDHIVTLASFICGTPISLISLISDKRQWFKAKLGITEAETPRELSFCQYAIQSDDILEIPDTLGDIRFYSNPFVTGNPNIRYYAGAPLVTNEGNRLGTLCVIDTVPRELSEAQKMALATLSEQVVAHLELRLKKQEVEEEKQQLKVVNQRLDEVMTFVNKQLPDSIRDLQKAAEQLSQDEENNNCLESESVRLVKNNISNLQNILAKIQQG
ncbi:GAF domain-containing protein [Adhaeribacter radiodurans]|uniref:GAF domain-containing protein n=1 Tax=Adhaeribacter radiodurans TaxID=2745197 RepID=A0A7L7L229_9BACT|nr:GAF domain-containing protein [Adhaeribacter radiodurans]QMU26846.1 GAF domain-containing protein [Adhaeribacter radiodurans]